LDPDSYIKTLTMYQGDCKEDNIPHGFGRLTYPEDDARLEYVGEFKDGVRAGKGTTNCQRTG
jgi:hypothetical protein